MFQGSGCCCRLCADYCRGGISITVVVECKSIVNKVSESSVAIRAKAEGCRLEAMMMVTRKE
jgi:hypothetical protein